MDILSRLQALPPGRFHYKLLVLVGIGWLFDAMDTGIVSFILPALGKEWSSTAKSAMVLSSVSPERWLITLA